MVGFVILFKESVGIRIVTGFSFFCILSETKRGLFCSIDITELWVTMHALIFAISIYDFVSTCFETEAW